MFDYTKHVQNVFEMFNEHIGLYMRRYSGIQPEIEVTFKTFYYDIALTFNDAYVIVHIIMSTSLYT